MAARKIYVLLSILFSAAFIISRLWLIEGDLAPFDLTEYQKIDEFYYAGLAFEWLEGKNEPAVLQTSLTALPGGIFYNICVYLNLVLLGDNYYGFRLNVVIISLATSIIFAWLMGMRFGMAGLMLSFAFYLISFSWFMSSLVVEPTIYRLFHTAVLILAIVLTSRKQQQTWSGAALFLISLLAYAGFFFVYPTNFFTVVALAAYQVWRCIKLGSWREFGRFLTWNLTALVLACVLWMALNEWIFGSALLVLSMLFSVSTRVAGSDGSTLVDAATANFEAMQQFPLFVSMPGLFTVYWVSLAAMALMTAAVAIRMLAQKNRDGSQRWILDEITVVFSLFALALFSQTLFVNDYPVRKMVVALPFVIFSILLLASFTRSKIFVGFISVIVASALFVSNGPIVYRELFSKYSETMKEAMILLQPLGDAHLIGGFSHAFRLYNRTRPFLNLYSYKNGLKDMATYNNAMSGQIEGVTPEFSVQIEVSPEVINQMEKRGYVYEMALLSGTERGVGNVALFRWTGHKP